jgi:hypothetical protein
MLSDNEALKDTYWFSHLGVPKQPQEKGYITL